MKTQTVSVIIICYNQEDYIEKAFNSVVKQTKPPDEIVIIDDNSNDNSIKLLENCCRQTEIKTTLRVNSQNQGIVRNRNLGINETSCDLISFLDGDDYWEPNKLKNEFNYLIHNSVDIVFSDFTVVNKYEAILYKWSLGSNFEVDFPRIYKRDFPNNILFRSELVKKSCFEDVVFDENLHLYEDFDMRLRLSQKCSFGYINQPGSFYRKIDTSLSAAGCRNHLRNLEYIYDKFDVYVNSLDESLLLRRWKDNFLGSLLNGCFQTRFGSIFGKLVYLIILFKYPAYLKKKLFG